MVDDKSGEGRGVGSAGSNLRCKYRIYESGLAFSIKVKHTERSVLCLDDVMVLGVKPVAWHSSVAAL